MGRRCTNRVRTIRTGGWQHEGSRICIGTLDGFLERGLDEAIHGTGKYVWNNYEKLSEKQHGLDVYALKGIDAKTTACVVMPNPTANGWSVLEEVRGTSGNES